MDGRLTYDRTKCPPEPIRRKRGAKLACSACPKCAGIEGPRSPEVGAVRDLSPKNRQLVRAYHEVKAAGLRVSDPLFRRNLGVVQEIIDSHSRAQSSYLLQVLIAK